MALRLRKHCGECGHRYPPDAYSPDTCEYTCLNCGIPDWENTKPVSIVLIPYQDGLLVVERSADLPGGGKVSPPGGFLTIEDWRVGGARETLEEAWVVIHEPEWIRPVAVRSTPDGTRVLIFGLYEQTYDVQPFVATNESSRRTFVTRDTLPSDIAFPIHADIIRRYFAGEYTAK